MKPSGTYKIRNQRNALQRPTLLRVCDLDDPVEKVLARSDRSEERVRRIVDSLREEILGDGESVLRLRQVFSTPREIYRLEIERPEFGYQRITLLDRDALECLLQTEDVRDAFDLALSA